MGKTGETFIVGPDDLMRSNSRLFVEDPKRFVAEVVEAGTPPDVAQDSVRQKTTCWCNRWPLRPPGWRSRDSAAH